MFKTLMIACFSLVTVVTQAQAQTSDVLAMLQAVEDSTQVQASETENQSNDRTFRRGGGRGNGGGGHHPNRPPPQPRPRPGRPGYPPPGHGGGYPQPPRPPSYPGYPDHGYGVQCVVQDNGHEEHYRGHGSCGECLSLHGNCTETCSEQTSVCTAEGFDRYGNRINFEARGSDRYQAENEAYYRCQSRAGNCRITYCDERNEVVSRRYCR